MIISIFTPHGGCPERCHFCDQRVSGGEPVSAKSVQDRIAAHLASAQRAPSKNEDTTVDVAFYGGTFTGLPKPRQIAYLEAVRPYIDRGLVSGIRFATRPDAIDRLWLEELLKSYPIKVIELGVQSFNESALTLLGRTHTNEDVRDASRLIQDLGVQLGFHLMIGLPGETLQPRDEDAMNVECTLRLRPDTVRIHPLLVIRGTELAAQYQAGLFKPLMLESAVDRAAFMTEAFEAHRVKVVRLGLQPNELLAEDVLAGAFHPGFGELVRSKMTLRYIERVLKNVKIDPGTGLEIECAPSRVSQVYGEKRSNIKYLKTRFNLPQTRVTVVKGLGHEKIEVRLFNINRPT